MGAGAPTLVGMIECVTGFNERPGPPVLAYLGRHSALDRGIEQAARASGLAVRSRTRFVVRFGAIVRALELGTPVVLNCYRAPSGQWSHSVLAIDYALAPRRLLTLDPNDGVERWLTWLRPSSGWVCTATFIEPVGLRSQQSAVGSEESERSAAGVPV